ncbi:DUF3857 domain-containing protein [Microbacter margulisiae]|uniref:DUF3857 domain-containing protein n=1 Tax=Microbacter margulisiae TaxID=1350067 RepID=A0A7W5DRV3_9PORP|nr:DUF3857 domain-containing protein [Microbacter margulisiae]MBB3187063.1 hypothetical protein [Microbacter margulisiae]
MKANNFTFDVFPANKTELGFNFIFIPAFRPNLRWLLFLSITLLSLTSYAGNDVQKFGKISDGEIKMTTFPADTSASAVILYEKGTAYYQINQGFQVYYEIYSKIKILKPEGVKYANVEVPYVDYGSGSHERVQDIDGYVYNFVNGKVEKTRLDKKYIFTDNEEGKHFRLKFSLPNVKAGSLIEYKYTIVSDLEGRIRPWRFQNSIPVLESIYDVTVPNYFIFNINEKGYYPFTTKKEPVNQTFIFNGDMASIPCTHLFMKAENLPALKKESYVPNMNDYYSGVSFEISGVQVPGQLYKSFALTWNEVEKALLDDPEFGDNLKQSGFFKDEVKAIASSQLTDRDKIDALYHLVQAKVKWNKKEALYTSKLKKAIKDGVGNSAEINFILLDMLKDAGYNAFPVVMSKRSEGHLPIANPSIDGFNYFVVGVITSQDTLYMDASRKNAPINVLDEDYLVDRALAIRGPEGNQSTWVDLSHVAPSTNYDICKIEFENGKMIVNVTSTKNNQAAYVFRENYETYKNQEERIDALQSKFGISISNYSIQGLDSVNKPVVEKYTFAKPFALSDSVVFLNPLTIFNDNSNPFKAEKRDLPVEFSYPFTDLTSVVISVPKGYALEALPKSEKSSIKQNDATYRYMLQKDDHFLRMMVVLSLNETIYPVTDYGYLRDFWANLTAQDNQEIVLKKITL